MIPRYEPYVYFFSIANYDDTRRTDIPLEYTLTIRTTTNLPLEFKLSLEERIINGVSDIMYVAASAIEEDVPDFRDEDGTYFRIITAQTEVFGYTDKQKNIYKLEIRFPETYISNAEYQNMIEAIEITINSVQIMEEEEPTEEP